MRRPSGDHFAAPAVVSSPLPWWVSARGLRPVGVIVNTFPQVGPQSWWPPWSLQGSEASWKTEKAIRPLRPGKVAAAGAADARRVARAMSSERTAAEDTCTVGKLRDRRGGRPDGARPGASG